MPEAATIDVETTVIPFSLFIPIIKNVANVLTNVTDLYQTAQHNKRVVKLLENRINAANTVIQPLKEDKLNSPLHYANLQGLVLVLKKMETFCGEITQYNKLKKFLEAKSIESKYKDLCKDYDNSVSALSLSVSVSNLAIMTEFKANSESDFRILKEEIEEVLKFLSLFESMIDANKKTDKKLTNANEKLDDIFKQVSEMHDIMQKLQNEHGDKSVNQKKIDNIFNEVPLPFDDYREANEDPRNERLRKYIHIKNLEEYAFKTVEKDHIDQVKNQVTILKKIQDCQNVIRFYGFTVNDEDEENKKYYLVTEWAEKGNLYECINRNKDNGIDTDLKLRFAFDIAKGLNFLNALKIVHQDIRSENIVITDRDVAKITNFKLSTNEATGNLYVNKEIVRHNSPEILKRGTSDKSESKKKKKYDTKCEVYSFGILLWEIAEFKIAYQDFGDFVELLTRVMEGYREPFSPNTDIPEKYKQLVIKAVDQDPDDRPTFATMFMELQDIFRKENPSRSNTAETFCASDTSNVSNTLDSNRPKPPPPARKRSLIFNWNLQTITIDEAIKHHNEHTKEKSELYKCFDSYAIMGDPKGKYWKAYYINKGWSDLKSSQDEKNALVTELFKEVADYGDEFPEAQLRYALMINRRSGPTEEAIEYLLKASNNDHPVAMFNVATYYFGKKNEELGRYYMIKSANKKYPDAFKYCKEKKILVI